MDVVSGVTARESLLKSETLHEGEGSRQTSCLDAAAHFCELSVSATKEIVVGDDAYLVKCILVGGSKETATREFQ